jgi:hypothetical protein
MRASAALLAALVLSYALVAVFFTVGLYLRTII